MRRELLAIVGLTATGKGRLALDVAEALGGPERVSLLGCDSAKVYRGADVGTAKLTGEARRGFEFFGVDVVDPGVPYSAGRYQQEGREACEALWRRGRLPVVVGGTGLYLRALLDGLSEAPPADEAVRRALLARRAAGEDLHAALHAVDPEAAARIAPADAHRIIRALEVYELTGFPLSELHGRGAEPFAVDKIAVFALEAPRPWLAERVERRTRRMREAGLLAETRELLRQVDRPTAPPLTAVGYRQLVQFLHGAWSEEEAYAQIARDTLRLAKRQRTWFKREARAAKLEAAAGPEALRAEILRRWGA